MSIMVFSSLVPFFILTKDITMEPRLENVGTPQTLPPPAQERRAEPKCGMKTGPALVNSAALTVGAARLLGDPQLSLFLNGMKLMFGKQDMFGLSGLFGALMVLASPMWGIVRLVVGGGGTVIGAAATTATGVAYVGELAIKGMAHKTAPTEAQLLREDLTKRFVNRMNETIRQASVGDRAFFRQNINHLMAMSVLKVAFLSRVVADERVILVNGERFGAERLANQDEITQSYFDDICEMKLAIREMNLSPNDEHGWNVLKNDLIHWTPKNEIHMEKVPHERLTILWGAIHSVVHKLSDDAVFARIWRESQNH